MALTDTTCKNAKPKEKQYKLADGNGLYLLVTPNGGKYWRMKYRVAGKEKLLSFGVYPEVPLLEAREKRQEARKLLRTDTDPAQAKREEKRLSILNKQNNFEAVAREWHENKKDSWTEQYGINVLHRLEMDIFPTLGKRPIADIEPMDMLDAIRQIEKRGALDVSKRIAQVCGQVFRFGIATGRVKRNPVPDIKDAFKPTVKGHFAAIDSDGIPDFMRTLDRNDARLFPITRIAIHLMLLTFVRTSNLINARWEDFDLEKGIWIIPAAHMKQRKVAKLNPKNSHTVPLCTQAIALLNELRQYSPGDLLFPGRTDRNKPMSNNTILGALSRMGYKGEMTGHGFRALAMSTLKEKLGYRHEVVDRQLAHAHKSAVDAAYDRAKFLDERKTMMQVWADYLDAAASGKVVAGKFGKVA
jgi:integrase